MANSVSSDALHNISLFLLRILRNVGINRKIRRRRQKIWTQFAEVMTLTAGHRYSIFGSQVEGSTTPDLKSDVDIVMIGDGLLAVENVKDSIHSMTNVLMIANENTYPGYFKLQKIDPYLKVLLYGREDGMLFTVDKYDQRVLNAQSIHFASLIEDQREVHGPAATKVQMDGATMDFIIGIKVNSFVQKAIPWLQRPRRNKWITPNDCEYWLQKEVFLVPVGCPLSLERHLEWRISFTTVERKLMWMLNNTQMACYVLMKMINKCFITPIVGESLSSYQCKTALFYLIDNTEISFWIPKNLLVSLNLLLRTICNWVDAGICPNYFIPAEDMFQGKVNGPLRRRLHTCLVSLMNQDFKYLIQITYDGVGQALSIACMGTSSVHRMPWLAGELESSVRVFTKFLQWAAIFGPLSAYTILLKRFECKFLLAYLIWRYQTASMLLQEVLSLLLGFLYTHIGCQITSSCLAAHSISNTDLELAHTYLHIGSRFDVTSGRLKLAGFYLRLGYASLAEEILNAVERDFNQFVSDVSVVQYVVLENVTVQKIISDDLALDEIYRKYIAVSVVYLPSEIHCTLPPMCYEMFRSVYSDPKLKHYWYDWAVVDARPFLYFLQHQTYSALGMNINRLAALENLVWSIEQKRIRHHDTCHNLLAYCLRQEGLIYLAIVNLKSSLMIKPKHNAAVWQLCLIFHEIINNETIYQRS